VVNEGDETLNGHDTRPSASQDSSLNDDRIFLEDEDAAEEDGVWGTPTADENYL
jgi:midasin (ATPase involved in ribosome maturation)